MSDFFDVVKLLVVCGTVLLGMLMVLLAMPKSYLRNFLVQVIGWAMTAFCGVYVVSPVDLIPDVIPVIGWVDDVGALVAGLASGVAAYGAGKDYERLKHN